jgi:signal transduction histidine kinase
MVASVTTLTLLLLVIATIGVTAALLAWRERPEPGATALTALLAGQVWWTIFYIFETEATTLASKLFWANLQWIGVVTIPVAWVVFSLSYTGNDRYLKRRYILLLSVIPAVTVLIAMTDSYHSLLYTDTRLVEAEGTLRLSIDGGIWFWVIAIYTYLLGLLGSIPLLQLIQRNTILFRGQSIALLIGTLAPWVSNAIFLSGGLPTPGFDPTLIAFSVSGVAYLGALTRFQLLGTSPAPNRRARHLVFERLHDGAVVVDSHDYIVDMNDSATEILETTYTNTLGKPAAEVIPAYETIPRMDSASKRLSIETETGTQPYDATVTEITDSRDRPLGRVISFHNVSDYLRQQQRLEVLNRVLRHNIRTETNLIHGYAEMLETDENESTVNVIKEHALQIEEMGTKSRSITDIFEQRRSDSTPVVLDSIITDSIATVTAEHPTVEVSYTPHSDPLSVDAVLEPVVYNLIENAAVHNTNPDPQIDITVERDGATLELTVTDNGPGIDDYEQAVLANGTETALDHGSGLGLWLIVWGTDLADGNVTFGKNEPTGSVVTVCVPVCPEST